MSKIAIYSPPATAQIKNCTADFDLRRAPVPVNLVQYDKTIPILAVSLYKGGTPYALPADAEVNIRMGKRNNLAVYNPALGCNESRDMVYVAITPQMTTQAGTFDPILEVLVDGGVAGTSPLQLVIRRNPVQEDAIDDTSEKQTLADLVRQAAASANAAADTAAGVEQYVEQANTAAEKAETSATAAGSSADQAQAAASAAGNFAQAIADAAEEAQESANTAAAAKSSAEDSAAAAEKSKTAAASSAKAAADTKADIDSIIAGLGAGDMAATTYDPQGKGTDIYEYADSAASSAKTEAVKETANKLTEKMDTATYDPDNKAENVYAYADTASNDVRKQYKAMYLLDGWTEITDETIKAQGWVYEQTVTLIPKVAGVPAVTAESEFLDVATYDPPESYETCQTLDAALAIIAQGRTESGDNNVTTRTTEKPGSDIEVIWRIQP